MTEHMPGPWLLWHNEQGAFEITPDNHIVICARNNFDHRAKESIANAHLIAAAPEMLAALKAINAWWESDNFSRRPDLWDAMHAAIAKAEGRS